MWNMLFALFLSGAFISGVTDQDITCFILCLIGLFISLCGVIITEEKQKEKIETLEKKLNELVGEINVSEKVN